MFEERYAGSELQDLIKEAEYWGWVACKETNRDEDDPEMSEELAIEEAEEGLQNFVNVHWDFANEEAMEFAWEITQETIKKENEEWQKCCTQTPKRTPSP